MTITAVKSENSNKIDSTPSVSSEKKRGRPLGAIRETFFSMAALVDGELVHELIPVSRGEKITHEEMSAEARKAFLKKYKVDAESEHGPIFKASLMQTSSTKKRQTIRLSEEDLNYTGRKIQAEYNGWIVTGRYFENEDGEENSETIRLFYKKEIPVEGKKKRVAPQPTFKAVSELSNIQELSNA